MSDLSALKLLAQEWKEKTQSLDLTDSDKNIYSLCSKELSKTSKKVSLQIKKSDLELYNTIRDYYKTKTNSILSELLVNPILSYLHNDPNNYLKELIDVVSNISKDPTFNKYLLIVAMDHFAECYETFRPHRIEHGDHYRGTVNTMDNIYGTLYAFLEISPIITFSNYGFSNFNCIKKVMAHNEVDWSRLKNDLEYVKEAIIKTIKEKALEALLNLGTQSPFIIKYYVIEYIREHFSNLTYEQIEILSSKSIKINGYELKFTNKYDFLIGLEKLKGSIV